MKNGFLGVLIMLCACLSGCLGGVWTGASMVYDRHNVYRKINNYQLLIEVTNALFPDQLLKGLDCYVDVTVFNGDVLIVGHLPTPELIALERSRLRPVRGYRHLYNEVSLGQGNTTNVTDGWITAKIRSQMLTDDVIEPSAFKIITSDNVVYLMGDVKAEQGEKVIKIARKIVGVQKVVTLLRYYTYETKKNLA